MKNVQQWTPSKFVFHRGRLVASGDPEELRASSRLVANRVAALYQANISEHVKGKLIDLGCGRVPFYEAYKDFVSENVCVDWENTLHKNGYLDHECDLTKELPFDYGEFDTIILSDVLEHIPQPDHLWKEMSRILKPGGKVLMNVPFYYWMHEAPHDYYRYTEYALQRFADLSGFRMIVLKPIGGAFDVLADILAKHFQYAPLLGRHMAIGIQSIAYAFLGSSFGRKLSEKTSHQFPLGYFLVAEKIAE